jgi:hypothetical protein
MNTVNQTYPQPSSTLAPTNTSGNAYSRSSSRQPPLIVNTSLETRQHLPTPMSGVTFPQQHLPFSSSSSAGSAPPEHLPPTPPTSAFLETHALSQDQYPEDPTTQPSLPDTTAPVEMPEDRSTGSSTSLLKQTSDDQPFDNARATPTPSVASPPKSGLDALKRTNVDMSGDSNDSEAQQRKKPRLDGQENGAEHVERQAAVSNTGMEVDVISGKEEDEESDDGVIEIGPDGLRLEEDCLAALIDEIEEDGDLKVCKLCK